MNEKWTKEILSKTKINNEHIIIEDKTSYNGRLVHYVKQDFNQ